MTSSSEQADSNGKARGGGTRAITRGEEARVRAALAPIFMGDGDRPVLQYDGDRLTVIAGEHYSAGFVATRNEIAARAGIVPGAEGWCWAAAPAVESDTGDECIGCSHSRGSHDRSGGGCIYCNCPEFRTATAEKPHAYRVGCAACKAGASHVEEPKAAPSWLTAAVLAALPPNGDERTIYQIDSAVDLSAHRYTLADVPRVLAHLVSTGEIEAVEGGQAWRRWGVPEGWSDWTVDDDGASNIACLANPHIAARAYRDGEWKVWDGQSSSPQWQGRAKPGRLANAKRTALQTCHAMLASMASRQSTAPGVEGAPVRIMRDALIAGLASPAPAAPAPTRAEQVRLALLAVLTRGPVAGLSRLLTALDGEGVQPAADGRECREAAREIGATVDGARWSLPAMVPGWGWHKVLSYRWRLCPNDLAGTERESVATVEVDQDNERPAWSVYGGQWTWCESVEEGQTAALWEARRAGLFARPPEATAYITGKDGTGPTVGHDGKPTYPAPHGPLDAAVLAILATASCAEITAHLEAWGASLIAEARRGAGDTIDAVPHAVVQSRLAQRAYTEDAPLLYAVWQAAQRVIEARGHGDAEGSPIYDALDALATAIDAKSTPTDPRLAHTEATLTERTRERDVAESQVAFLRPRLLVAEEQAHAAEQERDAARADLAALQRGLDGLRTWATSARGGAL